MSLWLDIWFKIHIYEESIKKKERKKTWHYINAGIMVDNDKKDKQWIIVIMKIKKNI